MSSILLPAKHFKSANASLHRLICYTVDHKKVYVPYKLQHLFDGYKYGRSTSEGVEEVLNKIFRTLYAISSEAVGKQYGEFNPMLTEIELEEYDNCKNFATNLTHIETYKALTSISYQIEIEKITESNRGGIEPRELTQDEKDALAFLEAVSISLADKIVTLTAEYDKAQWMIS